MFFKLLTGMPFIGDVLRIFNAYAFRGDALASDRFASPWLWVTAFWVQCSISAVATVLCMPALVNEWLPKGYCLQYEVDFQPGPAAVSILPNLLGFGIGIYALIFGLHKLLLRQLQDSYTPQPGVTKRSPGSALILNAEMAVPLLVLALAIVIGLGQQVFSAPRWLQAMSWFSLWLSLTFTIELICTLFGLGENSILKSLAPEDPGT